jgi:CubicO group peptidase (beta-lactamase class C family)
MNLIKQPLGFCLLLIVFLQNSLVVSVSAQTVSKTSRDKSSAVEERIKRVENNLLPPVRIKGDPQGRMNIAERMKHYKVLGVSIAVINDGKIEWARGYGVREVGTNQPVTPETLFQAASISKPIAAAGALQMVEDEKVILDEDVNNKLISWKVPENEFTKTEKVTLRRLLSHGAGLVMTDVSGKPFPRLMNETVFKKLKMKNSTFEAPLPEKLRPQAAAAHNEKGEKLAGGWLVQPEAAAAGLWSTPTDLARFAIELQTAYRGKSEKILSPETVKQMMTRQIGKWGLGVQLDGEGKAARFSHAGSNEGYRCIMLAYLETGQGAVVMTNSDNAVPLVQEILRSIALEYGWTDYLPPEKEVVAVDPQKFAPYVGEYDSRGRGKWTVFIENGKLIFQPGSTFRFELLPESETKFFVRERPDEVVFVKDAEGRVTEMILYLNGQENRLKKL